MFSFQMARKVSLIIERTTYWGKLKLKLPSWKQRLIQVRHIQNSKLQITLIVQKQIKLQLEICLHIMTILKLNIKG